jgi:hypothetical protein
MNGEPMDARSRILIDDNEKRRRAEADALAELARLVEEAEPAFFWARPSEQGAFTQDKRRA